MQGNYGLRGISQHLRVLEGVNVGFYIIRILKSCYIPCWVLACIFKAGVVLNV
jgi:hypothetical protein